MSFVSEAEKLVLGQRNADYGPPKEDFECLAKIWSGLMARKLKADLEPRDIALMMTALKLNRLAFKHKPDSAIDAHGYLLTYEWIETGFRPMRDDAFV